MVLEVELLILIMLVIVLRVSFYDEMVWKAAASLKLLMLLLSCPITVVDTEVLAIVLFSCSWFPMLLYD